MAEAAPVQALRPMGGINVPRASGCRSSRRRSPTPTASSPSSPSSITEEIFTRTMSDVVKDFDTEELIDYLGRKDLKLDEDDIKILRKEKIAGSDFL